MESSLNVGSNRVRWQNTPCVALGIFVVPRLEPQLLGKSYRCWRRPLRPADRPARDEFFISLNDQNPISQIVKLFKLLLGRRLGRAFERNTAAWRSSRLGVELLCVCKQVAGLTEAAAARLANVRLLARVRPHVGGQVAPLSEVFAARRADERPLSGVQSQVVVQATPRPKVFPARVAAIRSLARVDSHVDVQEAAGGEVFCARFAPVRLLSCVRPHVSRQVPFGSEHFPTGRADKRFLARVDSHVVDQLLVS